MKQILRRITSLVMALLVLVSLLPLQSFATEADSIPPATTDETLPTDGSVQDQEETTNPTETAPTETLPYDPSLFQGIQSEDVEFYLLSTKTRSIVDKAVKKISLYTGQTWYDVWYQNKWSGYWNVWGSWWYGEFSYFEFASGAIGYCIQPYNSTAAINQDRYPITWDDIVTPYESCSDGFEEAKAQGISLAMAYGTPNNGDTSTSGIYATAAMIWAIACGHIRPDGTIRDEETPFLKSLKDGFWDDPELYAEIEAKYNELLVCLQNHGKIPSFSAGSRAELTDANTITLQYDASSGLYTASVTDTNGILKYFNYQSSVEGLTFEKSGNTLIVKATPAAVAQLGSSSVIHSRGHEVTVGPDSVIVWNTEDNASQAMVTMNVEADPVPSYFTLAVPKGNVKIVKTTEDGKNLAGWQFGIYSDAACTTMISGPHTSGSDGTITVSGLDVGTVWVKEIGHSDAAINAMYQCGSTNPQQVTIQSGQTATVNFRNNLRFGKCQIIKTATNGGTVEGWEFTITDTDGNIVGTYTTDAAGTILVDLNPGTYTVQETNRNDPYWYCDTAPQTVTVKAGQTATVTFQNRWIGKAKIVKTLANPEAGTLKDWLFKIVDANGKDLGTYGTDDTGTILLDLEPGTYTVTEILEADSLWQCTTENPQTITVTAGQTAEVTFINALRSGEITIEKVNHEGAPLAGAEFLLEWSENGVNWHPVTYTDSMIVSKGVCSSANLQNGKLVSGTDGMVVFSGLYPTVQYRLTETKAPDGYQLLQGYAYEGVLPANGNLTVSLTVVNAPVFMLPETGSTDFFRIPLWTALCIWTGAGLLLYLRKRQGG